ncbi:undecaprenyl-diphosphatase [Silvimonas sp.]|uniref:undecaprenyl-diphosphatase n=1 Tax=Silvimonas sp. TaxID=2650811 RepID=UPI0028472295|nr:undecaprenyl-diphosphatase [Silvimonas sp.]MDR3428255.1 undecaprenyl-diphosphatase [Silvimonas sp.]
MEELNQALFLWMNAPAHPSAGTVLCATVLADYLIWLVPLLLVICWLCGNASTRCFATEAATAGLLALGLNQLIGLVWQHPRPFMIGVGHTLIQHVADSSFPSDHLTLLWAVAFSLALHPHLRRIGVALALTGLPVAWARIYLGVHFPLDMLGAAIVAALTAALCRQPQRLMSWLFQWVEQCYRFVGQPLIRRGWIPK